MLTQPALSPRAARTRAALIAAGFDLLAVKPIDAIPIDEVVATGVPAKGSFFNHFADKQAFAIALATEVRLELEGQVHRANQGVADPIERIANGMWVSAAFATDHPKRAAVLLRSAWSMTGRAHPLNKGVIEDFEEACRLGLLAQEARTSGVLYWLGLCQALMANLLERPRDRPETKTRIEEMMVLGLIGIGIDTIKVQDVMEAVAGDGGVEVKI